MGNFIAGLSWLMLSRPENASQAAEYPTRNVCRLIPSARLNVDLNAWNDSAGWKAITTVMTTMFTISAAAAMTIDSQALSRMPMMLTSASSRSVAIAIVITLCSKNGTTVPR
jgi:hypothetical protein